MQSNPNVPDKISDILIRLMEPGPLVTDFVRDELELVINYWIGELRKQRMLYDLMDKRVLLLGDIHGDYLQLRRAFQLYDDNDIDYIVINGDLIDRGSEMIECVEYVMSRQILDPKGIVFLRGNHEIQAINEMYGFRGYVTGVYGSAIYEKFSQAFRQLPIAAKIGDWGFVSHGGIPRETIFFHLMRLELKEPEPDTSPYAQLLWNDPDDRIEYFGESIRGPSYYRFGQKAFDEFMEFHNLDYYFRAHQAFPEGYRWFLLSIFSSNAGPYLHIDPHFALINQKSIELIRASSVEIDMSEIGY